MILTRFPDLRFTRLRTRLAVRYAALFGLTMLAVAGIAQVMIRSHAKAAVRDSMAASGQVYDRLWSLKARSLAESADVLARDFGFRSAVASRDAPTIASALDSLRARARVRYAFVVESDGSIVGDGSPALRALAANVATQLSTERRDAVARGAGGTWRFVVSPIMAPTQIGSVVFVLPLDTNQMRALETLSPIPLTASIAARAPDGSWRGSGGERMRATAVPIAVDSPRGRAFALVKPLPGPGGPPQVALMLSYPLAEALASYWALQLGIALTGLIGLLLVLHGSARLAAQLTAPIAALDRAAQDLERGAHAVVTVDGHDEIARLAKSFNRMSAGIVEREHRISHLAFHDTLTGLPNRSFFREQLELALANAARSKRQVAVLCLDLDGFKSVNDTLGHPVGDELLRIVAAALIEKARDGVVARLGGDEFAIILHAPAPDRPRTLAQSIIDQLRVPLQADGHQVATGASIGIAMGPQDGPDADQLLKNADLALYRAKQDGRGTFRFFEPALDAIARQRRQLELDLREALATGQLRLHYQPIYGAASGEVASFEALLRWEHPTRGIVMPDEFISVAEDTGLIVSMGEWTLLEACRQAASWPAHIRVAVNVSPLQFRNPAFAATVLQAVARAGLDPARLELEITESVFLEGEATTIALLHRLRGIGVRIALDDFGTGYSSLSYLRSFPFDKLKIDKSFVDSVANDSGAFAIVRAIIDLAGALGMETVAEGVESDRQLAVLREQRCGYIQGYLFSRPLTARIANDLVATAIRAVA